LSGLFYTILPKITPSFPGLSKRRQRCILGENDVFENSNHQPKEKTMKRRVLVMGAALGLLFLPPAFGQEPAGQGGGMMGGQMMGPGPMNPNCPQHLGMMAGLMGGTLVATTDGGVVLFAGQKLMKFDKDLKLVKEVEVKIDTAAMQKMMQEMYQNCPQPCWKNRRGPGGGPMMGPGGAPATQPGEPAK
jgi:hypothetical protein